MAEKERLEPMEIAVRLRYLAESQGTETAIVEIEADGSERCMTWRELFDCVEKTAYHMNQEEIGAGDFVVIGLPNCLEHVIASLAAWQLGACCIPVYPKLTLREKNLISGLVVPRLLVSDWQLVGDPVKQLTRKDILSYCQETDQKDMSSLPFRMASPARALATGGTTGTPKVVVQNIAMAYTSGDMDNWACLTGQRTGDSQLVPGSLYHTLYNSTLYIGLFFKQTIYLMVKFLPDLALRKMEEHQIQCAGFVPTMMERMAIQPEFKTVDLSSIHAIFHAGGACSARLKRIWIERLGAEKIYEFYSMTEMIGTTVIRGDDWLRHVGSVGKPVNCKIQIRDDDGNVLPPGEVGEIFCSPDFGLLSKYIGNAFMDKTKDNYYSVKDLGKLCEAGYLYIADRRSDMIVTGGKNVYTLEIEELLKGYPHVSDAVIIGMPDEVWGRHIHGILQLDCEPGDFSLNELSEYLHTKISGYKIPKTYEIVDEIPHNEMGKIRRKELVEERLAQLNRKEMEG